MLSKINHRPFNDSFDTIVKKFFNDEDTFTFPSLLEKNDTGKANIKELDDKYIIDLQVPGFDKEDINVELEGKNLKISAEVSESKEEFQRKEFFKSSFSRIFTLPKDSNFEEINAESKNGILSIKILKKEKQKKIDKKISIK
jgi:HSP20 family protein